MAELEQPYHKNANTRPCNYSYFFSSLTKQEVDGLVRLYRNDFEMFNYDPGEAYKLAMDG